MPIKIIKIKMSFFKIKTQQNAELKVANKKASEFPKAVGKEPVWPQARVKLMKNICSYARQRVENSF